MPGEASEYITIVALSKFKEEYAPHNSKDFAECFNPDIIEKISAQLRTAVKPTDTDDESHNPEASFADGYEPYFATEESISQQLHILDEKYHLCPGFFLNISEDNPEVTYPNRSNICGSFIHDDDKNLTAPYVPNWAFQRYSVKFGCGGTENDPFDDENPIESESMTKGRRDVRGQLFSYVDLVFKHQHRTAHFVLFINGSKFRAMRWDRAGVIVTPATEYATTANDTKVLLELLYGLSRTNPAKAGLDPTATRLSLTSCGLKRMKRVAELQIEDIGLEEFTKPDPTGDGVIPRRFQRPVASAPDSPLFGLGILETDPSKDVVQGSSQEPILDIPEEAPTLTFKYIRDMFRESLNHGIGYTLKVQGRHYLVGSASYAAMGPIGRGTRGYVALEWHSQRFVFLKDSWRPCYVGLGVEGEFLKTLNEKRILFIPTLVCHEDFDGQVTITSRHSTRSHPCRSVREMPRRTTGRGAVAQRLEVPQVPAEEPFIITPASAPSHPPAGSAMKRKYDESNADTQKRQRGSGLRHLVHSRLVVAEVCLPSTRYKNGKHLLQILDDSIFAHEKALNTCRIMHCDISAGNILIYPSFVQAQGFTGLILHGVLSDWELAKHIPLDNNAVMAFRPERMGTWQYMSVPCLLDKSKAVEIPDELESFFHVLIYVGLRFMVHSFSRANIHAFFLEYFDGAEVGDQGETCGPKKWWSILGAELKQQNCDLVFGEMNHPMNHLVRELLLLFQARLKVYEWDTMPASPAPVPMLPPVLEGLPAGGVVPDMHKFLRGEVSDPTEEEEEDDDDSTPMPSNEPDDATRRKAEKLRTHAFVRRLIAKCLKMKWPENDRVNDALMRDYDPSRRRYKKQHYCSHDGLPKGAIDDSLYVPLRAVTDYR